MPASARLRLFLAILLIWIGSSACQGVGRSLASQTPASCADCHQEIARQWGASAHAHAWTDPAFVAASEQHTKAECLGCHAPLPLLEQAGGPPRVRAVRRDDGVDCAACHKVGCAQGGPYDTLAPHATRRVPALRSSRFCGRCHEKEIEQYEALYAPLTPDAQQRSCADCHMDARSAHLTQGHLLSGLHPRRIVRDHAFTSWKRHARSAVEVTSAVFAREGERIHAQFALLNRGAGHRIPTGAGGHREVRIRVFALDEHGNVLGRVESSLVSAADEGLEPGTPRAFDLWLVAFAPETVADVRLLVERVNADESLRLVLVDRRWPLPPAGR